MSGVLNPHQVLFQQCAKATLLGLGEAVYPRMPALVLSPAYLKQLAQEKVEAVCRRNQ
jgi:hypothetical protein